MILCGYVVVYTGKQQIKLVSGISTKHKQLPGKSTTAKLSYVSVNLNFIFETTCQQVAAFIQPGCM